MTQKNTADNAWGIKDDDIVDDIVDDDKMMIG